MTESDNIVDYDDPDANMYGCTPCPACGGRKRWPASCRHKTTPDCIVCDDCGLVQKAVHKIQFAGY